METSHLTTKHQRFFNEKLGKKEIENVIKMTEGVGEGEKERTRSRGKRNG
jgi:hypothetical protein